MIHHGDCLTVMAEMPDASVDAIVTDPPYGLKFMGKVWDHGVPGVPFWAEMLRVLKPGGHLLSFGGTRTVHRIATNIEDAGFEIRDMLVWGYASGFPKSLDVSKAIDRAAGAEREVMDSYTRKGRSAGIMGRETEIVRDVTAPVTDAARQWNGWGTALKPAWEPIVMARKPLRGTVAGNVQEYGTGAINIDGCRIGTDGRPLRLKDTGGWVRPDGPEDFDHRSGWAQGDTTQGRWPANVILTDPIFDGGVEGVVGGGTTTSGQWYPSSIGPAAIPEDASLRSDPTEWDGDTGTYSRFFLIPKSSRSDREPVVRGQRNKAFTATMGDGIGGREHNPEQPSAWRENSHPTVKPTELMRHLVRLVTPPGGTVLDPFAGSGTTGKACELEGLDYILIEKETEYVAIIEARLNGTQRGMGI